MYKVYDTVTFICGCKITKFSREMQQNRRVNSYKEQGTTPKPTVSAQLLAMITINYCDAFLRTSLQDKRPRRQVSGT